MMPTKTLEEAHNDPDGADLVRALSQLSTFLREARPEAFLPASRQIVTDRIVGSIFVHADEEDDPTLPSLLACIMKGDAVEEALAGMGLLNGA